MFLHSNNGSILPQATERKDKLDESYQLQRFLADFRDLISWVSDMKAIISADELAKDVTGAEALVDRHSEHKVRKSDTDSIMQSYLLREFEFNKISINY